MFKAKDPQHDYKRRKSMLEKLQNKTRNVLLGNTKTTMDLNSVDGSFMGKGAISVVLCVSDKDTVVKQFAQAIRQKLRNNKVSAQVLTVRLDATKISMEDQLCISRCVLFCPIVDRLWFTCKLCADHYAFARKCAKTNGMGILPVLALSQSLGVEDPGVQTLMKSHECLYAKLHEVVDADLDVLVANMMRHLSSNKRIMEDQVEKSKDSKPPLPPKRASASSERVARREAAQVANAGARVSVSLLLTMTEYDLSLFGKMGSPGTQPTSQLRYTSILDLLNIYETHRFHLEKAAQVLQTLAPLLQANDSDRQVFQSSGWLPLLMDTHQHSPAPAMIQALKSICAACNIEVPKITDSNQTKKEILVGCAKSLQTPINPLHVGLCAAAVRHLSWNSRDVKTYAGRLHITTLLASHLPHSSQPTSPDASVLAAICLALATLVLEPSNKEMLRECGGLERVGALLAKHTDDFVIGASCACLSSCVQTKSASGSLVAEAALPEFIKLLVGFLQTPARSVYATQLLQAMIQFNPTVRQLVVTNGLFKPAAKILRYCMQARPLAYGSAVLCLKVVSLLSDVFVGLQASQVQTWIAADGIQLLVGLLEHKGYRNDITMDLQLLVCSCLSSLCRTNPQIIPKIGEDGGITKAVSAIKLEVEAAHSPPGNGMVAGRSEKVVTAMLRLVTELCASQENKSQMIRAGGIHVCLELLLPTYPAPFLQMVLDVLESSSVRDEKGHFVGWSQEDIATLSSFASKAAQAMDSVTAAQPSGGDTSQTRYVQDKATTLVNTVHYEPEAPKTSNTPVFASIVTPMPVAVQLPVNKPPPPSSAPPPLTSSVSQPVLPSSDSGFNLPRRSRVVPADTEAPATAASDIMSDGEEAARRLSKLISDMYQIARDLASDPSRSQPKAIPVEVKKDSSGQSQLNELEQIVSTLRRDVLNAEAAVAAAHNRLLQCDEEVDYCQEEIAATDLSLLLMEHEDQQNDDQDNARNDDQAGDEGMDLAGFGRDDDDEDLDVDHIHDLRNSLVAELEIKENERATAETELEAADANLQRLRNELADRERQLDETRSSRAAQGSSSEQLVVAPARHTQQGQDMLRKLIELKTAMMSDLVLINAHLRTTRSQPSAGSSASLGMASGDAVENHRVVATLIAEHEREKKRLLSKIRDAEDRAEAFASKIVDEYRMIKQSKQLKTERESLKLTYVLDIALDRNRSALCRSFFAWKDAIRTQNLQKRVSEVDMRDRLITKTLLQNHTQVRDSKLGAALLVRSAVQQSRLKNALGSWRIKVQQIKAREEKIRSVATKQLVLESSLAKWQNLRLTRAFSKWREEAYVGHRLREQSRRVAARNVVDLLLNNDLSALRHGFKLLQTHALASKVLEQERLVARYALEASKRESELTIAQRQAEEKARRLAEERQMTLMEAERMRHDIKKQQQNKLLGCITRIEQRSLAMYVLRWRKWTRAQMLKDFERLQRSMNEFDTA